MRKWEIWKLKSYKHWSQNQICVVLISFLKEGFRHFKCVLSLQYWHLMPSEKTGYFQYIQSDDEEMPEKSWLGQNSMVGDSLDGES